MGGGGALAQTRGEARAGVRRIGGIANFVDRGSPQGLGSVCYAWRGKGRWVKKQDQILRSTIKKDHCLSEIRKLRTERAPGPAGAA